MPYGIAKKAGGDSPSNTAKMESCVQKLMKEQGYSKLKAILICKSSIQKSRTRKR